MTAALFPIEKIEVPRERIKSPTDNRRAFVKLFNQMSRSHGRSRWEVFADFVEMAAISLRQTTRPANSAALEERYMALVQRHDVEDVRRMPHLLAHVAMALGEENDDFLGGVAGELELLSKHSRQFFTPFHLSEMMARMLFTQDSIKSMLVDRGFVTACEPASGAGGMVLACAKVFRDEGYVRQSLQNC